MEVRMSFVNEFVSAVVSTHKHQLNLFMAYNLLHSLLCLSCVIALVTHRPTDHSTLMICNA